MLTRLTALDRTTGQILNIVEGDSEVHSEALGSFADDFMFPQFVLRVETFDGHNLVGSFDAVREGGLLQ